MFVDELKVEFISRIETILNRGDLTENEMKETIGKLFVDFEKRNKAHLSKLVVPPLKAKRQPTAYNLFIKEKMNVLEGEVVPSKLRFKTASSLWKKDK